MSLKFGLTQSEVRKKFDECDLNRDGKITLTEMMTLYTKKLKVSDKEARVYVEVNNCILLDLSLRSICFLAHMLLRNLNFCLVEYLFQRHSTNYN